MSPEGGLQQTRQDDGARGKVIRFWLGKEMSEGYYQSRK